MDPGEGRNRSPKSKVQSQVWELGGLGSEEGPAPRLLDPEFAALNPDLEIRHSASTQFAVRPERVRAGFTGTVRRELAKRAITEGDPYFT